MSQPKNTCHQGGRTANAHQPIPVEPFDFVWPSGDAFFGCNHLVVAATSELVRQHKGLQAAARLSQDQIEEIHGAADWGPFVERGWLSESKSARLYVSTRHVHVEMMGRFAEDDRLDEMAAMPPWTCGGHPRLEPPFELDGERIGADTHWPHLIVGVIRGERAVERPAFTRRHALGWVRRLYHLIEHTDLAAALAESVAARLDDSDVSVRAACARFFSYLPSAPGGGRCGELVLVGAAGFRGVRHPVRGHETLDTPLLHALAARLEASPSGSEAPMLLEAAREAVSWGTPSTYRLVEVLGSADPAWLAGHASSVLAMSPDAMVLGALLKGLQGSLGQRLGRLAADLYRGGAVDRPTFESTIRAALTEPARSQVLAAIQ